MNLELTQEQSDFVATVRQYIDAELPLSTIREEGATGRLDEQWAKTAELGWLAVAVPEEYGGIGAGLADEVLLVEELGRGLVRGPYLPTLLASRLAVRFGDGSLAEAFASGAKRAAVAKPHVRGAEGAAPSYLVVDYAGADYVLVWDDDVILAEMPEGVTQVESIDPGTLMGEVTVADWKPVLVAWPEVREALRTAGSVLSAAMLAGMMHAMRDMSVEYAKTRTQFGSPIGRFQAVSRRCADMAVRAWSCSSLARMAALAVDSGRRDAAFLAASAKSLAGEGAQQCARDNIQNLGGIGFTAEHDAHFYYKRARVVDTLWGDSRQQATRINGSYPGVMGLGD